MARRLDNNETYSKFHYRHYFKMSGFPRYHNTNIDKLCKFLDHLPYKIGLDYDEQNKAYDIDYAHGLELDDEFGDPYGIDRNGLDDDTYRFILKCHILAIKCNGTLPELIHFIATVLGCSDNDVTLGMSRHYVNGRYNGEPDTILIKNININNVANDHLVPLLSNQLQLAVAADKRVGSLHFFDSIPNSVYTALTIRITEHARIPIKANISDNLTTFTKLYTGISVAGHTKITTCPMKIHYISVPVTLYAGIYVDAHEKVELRPMKTHDIIKPINLYTKLTIQVTAHARIPIKSNITNNI